MGVRGNGKSLEIHWDSFSYALHKLGESTETSCPKDRGQPGN